MIGPVNAIASKPSESPPILGRFMAWLIERTTVQTPESWIARYGTAAIALALATLLRLALNPILEERVPFGITAIATTIVAWRCGMGPALATLFLGVLVASYLFEDPPGTVSFEIKIERAAFVTTILLGSIVTFLIESLRRIARDNARLCFLAQQSDARKDEFLATLAHELRNPLAPIRSALYLLEKSSVPDPRSAELHQILNRQMDHLVRLVDDLLDVARVTQGKIELRRERVELRRITSAALEIVEPMVREKGHQLHVDVPNATIYLEVDGIRIVQALANLLNNAAKYTNPGGQIWLTAQPAIGDVVLRVRDNGIGIEPEMQSRIFHPFEQAEHAIEHARGGLGMGLTLVRVLVELHGGSVKVHSLGVGLGSEFTVRLPGVVDAQGLDAPTLPGLASVISSPTVTFPSLKILVVDDNPSVAKTLELVLKHWSFDVQLSLDGFSALETARIFQPDVVLTDLGLPQMNGYQFAQELRRLPGLSETILIAISGYGQPTDLERSRIAGFARHLVKPVNPSELEQILNQVGSNVSARKKKECKG